MTGPPPDRALDAEARRVRALLEGDGRSEKLLLLFDYLLAHSQDMRAPKEIEIAFEVFGKDERYDTSQDAMVRVYVHRLRGRINALYENTHGPRLTIPKGQYQILLVDAPADKVLPSVLPGVARDTASKTPPDASWLKRGAAFAFLLTGCLWGVLFYTHGRSDATSPPPIGAYRYAEARCGAPLVVVGDSYLYFQSEAGGQSPRLVMRPTVQSAAQLETAPSTGTAEGEQVRDRDDYEMSTGSAEGLWSLLSALTVRRDGKPIVPAVLPMSKFTPEGLNGRNILYFGRLDQLGMLHAILFQVSRFNYDPISDDLVDPDHRRTFQAKLTDAIDEKNRNPLKRPAIVDDYGYYARLTKPDGCALWIIAGLQDSALPQMARIALDPAQLATLARQSQTAASFEALYDIRSLGELRYKSKLLLVRPLKSLP